MTKQTRKEDEGHMECNSKPKWKAILSQHAMERLFPKADIYEEGLFIWVRGMLEFLPVILSDGED